MIVAPNCNTTVFTMGFTRGYAAHLLQTSVNTMTNVVKGFKTIKEGMAKNKYFQESSVDISSRITVKGKLPDRMEMFRKDNVLALTIAKTIGSKIDKASRNLLEAGAIASVLNGNAFKIWKLRANLKLSIKSYRILRQVATGPYPGI